MTTDTMTPFDIDKHLLSVSIQDEGVWYALEPWINHSELRVADEKEAAVRVRPSNHPAFREALRRCQREHNPMGMERTQAQEDDAINDAMSRALVTGLRGLRINGQDVSFTPQNVRAWLGDRRLPQFRTLCFAGSNMQSNFREIGEERRAGN